MSITATASRKRSALTGQQMYDEVIQAGGTPVDAAFLSRIGSRESGGRYWINNAGLNKNGTTDWGWIQANDVWRKDPVVGRLFRTGKLLTPEGGAEAGLRILHTQGRGAWATYNKATDDKYLKDFSTSVGTGGATTPTSISSPENPQSTKIGKLLDVFKTMDESLAASQARIPTMFSVNQSTATSPAPASPYPNYGPTPEDYAKNYELINQLRQPVTSSSDGPNIAGVSGSSDGGGVSAHGKFTISGPNPGRIQKPVIQFAQKVAGVYGHPLTGSDGTGHSKYTTSGNVSDHFTGHATDIPATGEELIRMGQAALITAGMPEAQARRQRGGLFNVNGHQVIFNTHEGGDHTNHLHISAY